MLENEVCCIDTSSVDPSSPNSSNFCSVGLWNDNTVRILSLPNLREISKVSIPGGKNVFYNIDTIPRSILSVRLENISYLMVALGDGQLFNYVLSSNFVLKNPISLSLGTTPLKLCTFFSNGSRFVFCSSDRPTVIYSRSDKLIYSYVNLRDVSCVSPFNTTFSENGLAIATENELKIGVPETVQKLHVKSVHIGETVRRISYHEETESFGILTVRQDHRVSGMTEELSSLKILHGKTFEGITHIFIPKI